MSPSILEEMLIKFSPLEYLKELDIQKNLSISTTNLFLASLKTKLIVFTLT